jgi:hypothetical protein
MNETKRIAIPTPGNNGRVTIILEARVFRLDLAIGSLAWARPGAVIKEASGEKTVWSIPDATRRWQMAGIILALVFFLIGLRFK